MSKRYIDFAAVKAAVGIEKILDHYGLLGGLKPCGQDALRGTCPIHRGTNPKEFSVNVAKNCWHCFSPDCGRGGNVLDFVAALEDTDVHAAATCIDEWFRLGLAESPGERQRGARKRPVASADPPTATPDPAPSGSTDTTADVPNEPVEPEANRPLGFALKHLDPEHPYFSERGLHPETVAHFGLGYCQKGTMAGRIAIPLHNTGGQLIGYAGRWPGEPPEERPKYKFPKGYRKSLEVFNLHRLGRNGGLEPLIIVEGAFDCMWLWQQGYGSCVALLGSSLSDAQERAIVAWLQGVEAPQVTLLFDEDDAGRKGRDAALLKLGQHANTRVVSPGKEGCQPDGLGADALADLML